MSPASGRSVGDATTLAGLVTRLRRALRSGIRSEIPWERLPMAQVELLQRLQEEPGLRVGELAARQHLATNTVSTLVQQMVDAGLVERSPDAADRRVLVVTATTAGRAALRDWQRANARRIEAGLRALDPAERESLTRAIPALTRFVEALEAQGADPSPPVARPRRRPATGARGAESSASVARTGRGSGPRS